MKRLTLVPLLTLVVLLPACHKKKPNEPVPVETVIESSLVFQRADSTFVAMGETPLVCCGLYDPGFVNERAMRITFFDPAGQKSGWQFLILIDRAQAGATTTLPTVVVAPAKVEYVSMFVSDPPNELASDTSESSGTIVLHSFSCTDTAMSLDFTVDAVLGSEFSDGPQMRVTGTFRATFPAESCP